MSNQHTMPDKLIQFINTLQSVSRIGVQRVTYDDSKEWITEYLIIWGGQQWNIWHNKHTDGWGWEVAGMQGFSHVFRQGFDDSNFED